MDKNGAKALVEQANYEYEENTEAEEERHQERLQEIENQRDKQIATVYEETGLDKVIELQQEIIELVQKRTEKRTELKNYYFDNLPHVINKNRVTVNESITIRDGKIHKYNKKSFSKVSNFSRVLKNLNGITQEVNMEEEVVKEANNQLSKIPVRKENFQEHAADRDKGIVLRYKSSKNTKIGIQHKHEYPSNELPDQDNLRIGYDGRNIKLSGEKTGYKEEGYNPDHIATLIDNKDTIVELMETVRDKLQDRVQLYEQVHDRVEEIFEPQLIANKM